jgi:hypothetical protein
VIARPYTPTTYPPTLPLPATHVCPWWAPLGLAVFVLAVAVLLGLTVYVVALYLGAWP